MGVRDESLECERWRNVLAVGATPDEALIVSPDIDIFVFFGFICFWF